MRTKYPLPDIINPGTSRYVCVPVPDDPGHRQAFLGAILNLASWFEWQSDPLHRGKDAAAVWLPIFYDLANQLALAKDSCSEDPPGNACCVDYPPNADFIGWSPIDPYTNPETVPPGYQFPPWYVVNNIIPFTGLQPGDVMTDLLHGPIVEPFSSGFPRFRINVSGPGTVEVEFIRFPTAGVALISIDGQLGSVRWVDLHTSLAASIGSVEAKMIIPIEVSGPGPHHIDITMIYSITEAPPFVHFGGGIRKISLCGFGDQPENVSITEWEDELSLKCNIRWCDNELQILDCGEWIPVPVCGDGPNPVAPNQPGAAPRPAYGESECYSVVLAAGNQWRLPFAVRDGDTVTISEVQGAWYDGAIGPWYCPNGGSFVLGVCVGDGGPSGTDPAPAIDHMRVVYSVGDVWYDGYNTTQALPGGTGNQTLTLQANDSDLTDNRGEITLQICVQNGSSAPTATWCQTFDFTVGTLGWTPWVNTALPAAVYVSGQGWEQYPSHPGTDNIAIISPPAPPDTIFTRVTVHLDAASTDPDPLALADDVTGSVALATLSGVGPVYDMPFAPYTAGAMLVGYDPLDGGGAATVRKIVRVDLYGNGDNPFGTGNC